jgi:acetyl esterase/lipase
MARSCKWLLDQGIRPNHVALIGDSAGGGLAITTILRAREQGLPLPAATMPLSPWLDMDGTGETFGTNAAKDLLVTRDIIQTMASIFLGEDGNRQDPLANPLHADLKGVPGPTRHCSTTAASLPISRASAAWM